MSQNELLILNGSIVTLVVFSYALIRRKPKDPVRLNLFARDERTLAKPESTSSPRPALSPESSPAPRRQPATMREKNLTQPFEFRGESFEAYEVLGLPAGSSVAASQKAHDALARAATPEQRALFQAALQSILTSQN